MAGRLTLAIRLSFHNHAPQQLAIRLALHQQAADELGGDDLGGAGEEALGEELGERGGYGSGFGGEMGGGYWEGAGICRECKARFNWHKPFRPIHRTEGSSSFEMFNPQENRTLNAKQITNLMPTKRGLQAPNQKIRRQISHCSQATFSVYCPPAPSNLQSNLPYWHPRRNQKIHIADKNI